MAGTRERPFYTRDGVAAQVGERVVILCEPLIIRGTVTVRIYRYGKSPPWQRHRLHSFE